MWPVMGGASGGAAEEATQDGGGWGKSEERGVWSGNGELAAVPHSHPKPLTKLQTLNPTLNPRP